MSSAPRDPSVFLRHVLDEADFLAGASAETSREAYLGDEMGRRAFVRSLEIIGEAVKQLPAELKAHEPAIDWRSIARTRDRLIHGYFTVDYELVWDMAVRDVPALRAAIVRLLARLDRPAG
jgi:uncharacterized protein with HEPN domain